MFPVSEDQFLICMKTPKADFEADRAEHVLLIARLERGSIRAVPEHMFLVDWVLIDEICR